jgi:hypothetical protein
MSVPSPSPSPSPSVRYFAYFVSYMSKGWGRFGFHSREILWQGGPIRTITHVEALHDYIRHEHRVGDPGVDEVVILGFTLLREVPPAREQAGREGRKS